MSYIPGDSFSDRMGADALPVPNMAADASGTAAGALAKSCVLAGTRVIFELEWSPTQDRSDPDAEFQRARKLGYNFATMLPDKSLVGLARGLQPGPGRPYAAVVMLIERFSSGGAEAVLLSAGNRVAFIGLMDRRPVPGFDRLVSNLEAALALLKEFRDIHIDQDVRVATDLRDVIPNGEMLQVQSIFDMPEASSLVRPLVNRVLRKAIAAGVALALAGGGGMAYLLWTQWQERQAAAEAARLAQENDPNRLYENAIQTMLTSAGTPGNHVLDRWRSLLNRVPLTREGWALQRFKCTQSNRECEATWTRNFGNFHDFLTQPVSSAQSAQDGLAPQVTPNGNADLLGASITTHHVWDDDDVSGPHAAARMAPTTPQSTASEPRALQPAASPQSSSPQSSSQSSSQSSTSQSSTLQPSTSQQHTSQTASQPRLSRPQLPLSDEVTQTWGSRLQDVALVAGSAQAATLKTARLFGPPSVTNLQALRQPVVSLEWQVTDGLWSLPSIELPPSAVPESLTVNLTANQITYTLTGQVYAKGKLF